MICAEHEACWDALDVHELHMLYVHELHMMCTYSYICNG